jgi:hypothetical protein
MFVLRARHRRQKIRRNEDQRCQRWSVVSARRLGTGRYSDALAHSNHS